MNDILKGIPDKRQDKNTTSLKFKQYCKDHKLNMIINATHNPDFAPIEKSFSKIKNGIRNKFY